MSGKTYRERSGVKRGPLHNRETFASEETDLTRRVHTGKVEFTVDFRPKGPEVHIHYARKMTLKSYRTRISVSTRGEGRENVNVSGMEQGMTVC